MATVDEIEQCRPGYAEAVDASLRHEKAHQNATKIALNKSGYRYWDWGSIGAYIVSLVVPKAAGLYMLAFGWIALQYSLAWFANPLLIMVFTLARPKIDPAPWRWFAYCSLVLMFAQPMDSVAALLGFPFLAWVSSSGLLIIGIERYRMQYRAVLSEEP